MASFGHLPVFGESYSRGCKLRIRSSRFAICRKRSAFLDPFDPWLNWGTALFLLMMWAIDAR